MKILGHSHNTVINTVEDAVKRMYSILVDESVDNSGKCSGYFTLLGTETHSMPNILMICQIGVCSAEKNDKRFRFSQEKASRLSHNIPHSSSWGSRCPYLEMWGGAIRAKNLILSFSGLPELADEAVMLYTATKLGWLTKKEANEIAKISKNPYLSEMREILNSSF